MLLAVHVRNLLRFERWLRNRSTEPPPDMRGAWGEVAAITHRIYRRKVFHKRRVLTLFREFRRMTSAMPDGAILLGPNREILWLNRTAGRWLDLRRKVDRGIRIDNLVRHPEFVEYMESGGATTPPRIHLPKLGDRWLEFHLVKASDSEQQLLIVRNVTGEARLESMRKDFVANASHELRSPLTVISGYLDALAEDPVSRPGVARARARDAAAVRADARHRSGPARAVEARGPGRGGRTGAGRRGRHARDDPQGRAVAAAHPATVNLELATDAMLLGAENELHSVFSNLVSNAVKYTPADGTIDIRWWVDEKGGHVCVRDTGIGIPGEHLPRLTERFYRVDAGRSRQLGGSGLGLAIVKHALQRHDARLEIVSEEGKGSTFTAHFPAARVQNVSRNHNGD